MLLHGVWPTHPLAPHSGRWMLRGRDRRQEERGSVKHSGAQEDDRESWCVERVVESWGDEVAKCV